MKFEPLRDIVFIKRDAVEEKIGSIIIAGNKEEPPRGTVIVVGPGKILENGELIKPSVKVGDRVIFAPQSGHPVKLNADDDDNNVVMTEGEIIGIIKED